MIKRCFTNFTEKKVTTLYQSIIRPALEYASPVWNPWYKLDIDKLEKVQRKCLQLCSKEIELDSLDKRRKFTDCVETYKFVHNQYKTPASMYFKQPARELRGHSQKLMKQYSRTDIRKKFLLKPSGRHMEQPTRLSFFLSLLVRSYMSITPGSANLEILIK